eukprot:TRINITY_DN867_c0_g1_i1.p1 TRINITY_DN867_c0_g1~~TRINITY_DN867_c0_g1_i1.p1  ORF type:complete len:727 (+),score=197.67 TRINITY_DN867_c0_g1_i1:51-2183(+)
MFSVQELKTSGMERLMFLSLLAFCGHAAGLRFPGGFDVASTPPMGWNSWNFYGCSVDEQALRSAAKAMNASGLQAVGYEYINSDDCWMLLNRSEAGQLIPNPQKFPSGLQATIDYVHSLGLKFGLYTDAGSRTCAGFAGAYGHEAIDAWTYAQWELDYLKDDACNIVDNCLTDYSDMQLGLWASRRPMVLSVECQPPVEIVSQGGYGNMRRVGHDIQPSWKSMTSLVDQGSGLWPFAHNNSGGWGGWWNDLDMIEVGNGEFSDVNLAQAHFTMWCIMKAPLILGNNLSAITPDILAVLANPQAIAVNQDPLGIQARRLAVQAAASTTLSLPHDNVAVIASCDPTRPTQLWRFVNLSTPSPDLLYLQPCDPANVAQVWSFPGADGTPAPLQNKLTGQCIDAAANFDPGMLTDCSGAQSQSWYLEANTSYIRGNPAGSYGQNCLDVYMFTGPDVEIGTCKPPGVPNSNQQWQWSPSSGLIASVANPGKCLAASDGPSGGWLTTTDQHGQTWCLDSGLQGEGGWQGSPCARQTSQTFTPMPVHGQPTQFTFSADAPPGWNNDQYASGPLPHTRYVNGNWWDAQGPAWVFNLTAATLHGSTVQASATNIYDDNLLGNVTVGSDFCLDLTTMGMLEVWAAPLTGGRYAVALFNRSPAQDTITLDYSVLQPAVVNPLSAKFAVYDIWAAANRGTFQGSYSASVASHGTAFLVLTPA